MKKRIASDGAAYVASDSYYQGYKIGRSDLTAATTGPVDDLTGYSDPHVNSYIDDQGVWKVELTDRTGSPGQAGAGIHRILDTPITAPLPDPIPNLGIIANTYGLFTRGSLLYYVDNDWNVIQCADMANEYAILNFGPQGDQPAFTYTSGSPLQMGMRAVKVQEYDANGNLYDVVYALFSNGDSYSGPWADSELVRLVFGTAGNLIETNRVAVAPNATGLAFVSKYLATPDGSVPSNYLITTAIGGEQQSGSGNGVNSVVSVFKAGEGLRKIADPVVGTFALQDLEIDFKGVSAGPTVDNNAWVWLIGSSYTSSWTSNWTARQTNASILIEKALEMEADSTIAPLTMGDTTNFTPVDQNTFTSGYFYMVAFTSKTSDGNGSLLVGASTGAGDYVKVFQVTASGGFIDTSVELLNSTTLYGAANCNINSLTVFSEAGLSTYNASPPPPAARKKATESK